MPLDKSSDNLDKSSGNSSLQEHLIIDVLEEKISYSEVLKDGYKV